MRSLLTALIMSLLASLAWGAAGGPVFIIDIDGTLVQSSFREGQSYTAEDLVTITLDGEQLPNRVVNGGRELVESLSKIPGARVYFFSGGTEDRNLKLLKAIKTSDGRPLLDLATGLFSRHNLTHVEGERWGVKDVTHLVPDVDPQQVVFLDDVPEYMANGFHDNLIQVAGNDKLLPYAKELSSRISEREANLSFAKRNQLVWARGIIDRALHDAEAQHIPLVQALKNLDFGPQTYMDHTFYETGLAKLREVNGGLELVRLPKATVMAEVAGGAAVAGSANCFTQITNLLRGFATLGH